MSSDRTAHHFVQAEFEDQLEMLRPSTDLVQVDPIPEGYVLRQLRAEEERQYDALFHLAFADTGRFEETCQRALPEGFFVVEHLGSGALVASCVALRGSSSPRHKHAGQLGWLVTDPRHTRKGLGTIVSASVTNRLAREGYTRPFLGTEDPRTAAISIYLKLGWRPYLYRRSQEARWCDILARLGRSDEPIVAFVD